MKNNQGSLKMNTPQEQAALHRKAAETIEMCAPHGIEAYVKFKGHQHKVIEVFYQSRPAYYEFPLAVIEGQQVWADDWVYNKNELMVKAKEMVAQYAPYTINPPKPKTVMVELLVEDARYIANTGAISVQLHEACRKALDNIRGEAK
jgi:hypothetical protein